MRAIISLLTPGTERKVSLSSEIGDVIYDYLPECRENEEFRQNTPEFKEMLHQIIDVIKEHLPDMEEVTK